MQREAVVQSRKTGGFFGRELEIRSLVEALGRGTPLITITGPSGMGKSRLAKEVALRLGSMWEDEGGVFFIDLSPCHQEAEVQTSIETRVRAVIGERMAPLDALASRGPTLLILDGAEGVAGKIEALLNRLIEDCADLQILITSIIPVTETHGACFDLGPLDPRAAKDLYLDGARKAAPGHSFSASDLKAVEVLVQRLDRIPLAIELTAARMRVLPPVSMLRRLDVGLGIVSSPKGGDKASLLQALATTWALLSPKEQRFLREVSAFEGGFTPSAAARISTAEMDEKEVLDLLDGLRLKALVELGFDEQDRFSLLKTIQTFANQKLVEAGEQETIWSRHAAYFTERGEWEMERVYGPHSVEAIRWLRAERKNLSVILGRLKEAAPHFAARAGHILSWLVYLEADERPPSEELFVESLDAARRSGDRKLTLRLECRYGKWLRDNLRFQEALALTEPALEEIAGFEMPDVKGNLLLQHAADRLREDDMVGARRLVERALEVGKNAGEANLEVLAWISLTACAVQQRLPDEAAAFVNRALELVESKQLVFWEGYALYALAAIRRDQGFLHEAELLLQKVLEVARRMDGVHAKASPIETLSHLAHLKRLAGAYDEARAYALEGMSLRKVTGRPRTLCSLSLSLGVVSLFQGEAERAVRELGDAVAHAVAAKSPLRRARSLQYLAVAQAHLGRFREARGSFEEAGRCLEGCSDEVVWRIRGVLESCLKVASQRERGRRDEAVLQEAKERLEQALPPPSQERLELEEAKQLLRESLASWDSASPAASPQPVAQELLVGPEGRSFRRGEGPLVDLQRRTALRRIFKLLIKKRLEEPAIGTEAFALFDAGWPKVEIQPEAAARRVYIAVWTLRSLGLDGILLNQADGYLLDPAVTIVQSDDEAA